MEGGIDNQVVQKTALGLQNEARIHPSRPARRERHIQKKWP